MVEFGRLQDTIKGLHAGGTKKGKKTRQAEEEVGRQHKGMDRPGIQQVPGGSGEQGKMEKTGCKIICGAPTTLAVKGLMMMMMMNTSGMLETFIKRHIVERTNKAEPRPQEQ